MFWKVERASVVGRKSTLRVEKGLSGYDWSAGGEGWMESGTTKTYLGAKLAAVVSWLANRS